MIPSVIWCFTAAILLLNSLMNSLLLGSSKQFVVRCFAKGLLFSSASPTMPTIATQEPFDTCNFANQDSDTILTKDQWLVEASYHREQLMELLYPPGNSLKSRQHLVADHPIYNFLHRYYRYKTEDLMKFSQGMGVFLAEVSGGDEYARQMLHLKHLKHSEDKVAYYDISDIKQSLSTMGGKFQGVNLTHNRDVLRRTASKPPFFACFGLHEWAMLYSGRKSDTTQRQKHQENLPLRIEQSVVDDVVEGGGLKCTHYDAWRFFHPTAQAWNMINPMSRNTQKVYEQPACIHANMDLFKYAYQIYPFIPSALLRETLALALEARMIDMRASPYDVSAYCSEKALKVETDEGKMEYVVEQERLFEKGQVVRRKILQYYEQLVE